jgi:hypothetical protein
VQADAAQARARVHQIHQPARHRARVRPQRRRAAAVRSGLGVPATRPSFRPAGQPAPTGDPHSAQAAGVFHLRHFQHEWDGDAEDEARERAPLTAEQLADLRRELDELRAFHALAKSILKNSKGEALLTALRRGFDAAASAQTQQKRATLSRKAVIFTESRRTQEYLFRLLEETEFRGKVMFFNGTNSDPTSKGIYKQWQARHAGTDRISGSPSADMRAALVDHFRDSAEILIATEAAAEGINLQFCNLAVNYDLPWNPQRVEQRIGRCHRYGQEFDVVVVNFLNKTNAADQRVYQLLDEKFRLFSGVFGASDEVLGAVESGVDFEKRIAAIYQKCRTTEQIQHEFDELQRELEGEISAGQRDAREKLLDNLDEEVIEKVRIQSHESLDRFNERLWIVTQHLLRDHARFEDTGKSFMLLSNPFPGEAIHPGPYRMGRNVENANTFRVGHPLGQRVLGLGAGLVTPTAEVTFHLTDEGRHIAVLEPLTGKSGWLTCERLTVTARRRIIFCSPGSWTTTVWPSTTFNAGESSTWPEPPDHAAKYPMVSRRSWRIRGAACGNRCSMAWECETAAGSTARWISTSRTAAIASSSWSSCPSPAAGTARVLGDSHARTWRAVRGAGADRAGRWQPPSRGGRQAARQRARNPRAQ